MMALVALVLIREHQTFAIFKHICTFLLIVLNNLGFVSFLKVSHGSDRGGLSYQDWSVAVAVLGMTEDQPWTRRQQLVQLGDTWTYLDTEQLVQLTVHQISALSLSSQPLDPARG